MLAGVLILPLSHARADEDQLTPAVRADVARALHSAGFVRGDTEADDEGIKVDNAVANNGLTYDLKLDGQFRIVKSEAERNHEDNSDDND